MQVTLQRQSTVQTELATVPPAVHAVLRSPGRPMDAEARAYFEPRFGYDFGKVRVHSDENAAQSAQAANALAYTVGNHISFDAGLYRPCSGEGRRLIAHELAHVVQQSQNVTGGPVTEAHAEEEAERVALSATSSAPELQGMSRSLTAKAPVGLHRQQRGGQRMQPQPTAPNPRQQGIIDAARRAAAIRCQTAMFRVRGIAPAGPTGRIDAATEVGMRARSLAQVMFQWDNPNMEQVGEVVSSMVNFLTSGVSVTVAAANDPQCGNRAAYVRGLRPPITLCPSFFGASPEQRVRTMIHEAAHLARIGSADLGESYCVDFDCVTSCGGFDSADSWAQFVHCLSGQKADQPTTITGHSTGGRQGQTQQRGSGGGP